MVMQTNLRVFGYSLAGIALLEAASWFGWQYPVLGSVFTIALVCGWLWVASRNEGVAVLLLVVELCLGSQGYLISFKFGTTILSFRMVLFACAVGYILWKIISKRNFELWHSEWKLWYGAVLLAITWGLAVALGRGNAFAALFLDVNGFFYLALFPLFVSSAAREGIAKYGVSILTGALLWLSLKTLLVLYAFSHISPEALTNLYHWWRQTGFGEITYVSENFYRVFAQSQVYAALASALCFALLWAVGWRRTNGRVRLWLIISSWLALSTTAASLSRSFWLGLSVAWIAVPLLQWTDWKRFVRYLGVSLVLVLASLGTVLAITRLSWPLVPLGTTSAGAFSQRLGVNEAAGQSRLRLLGPLWRAVAQAPLIGSGYGATVTYATTDPRIVASTAGGSGITTTYAFEWGYLDLWYKLGIVAMFGYLLIYLRTLWVSAVLWRRGTLAAAVFFSLLCLMVIHLTTPYLNHPLGLGVLMAIVAVLGYSSKETFPYVQ